VLSQVDAAQAHLVDAIGDWDDIHSEALREVRRAQALAEQEGASDRDRGAGRADTQ
jgi:hypothetical protein